MHVTVRGGWLGGESRYYKSPAINSYYDPPHGRWFRVNAAYARRGDTVCASSTGVENLAAAVAPGRVRDATRAPVGYQLIKTTFIVGQSFVTGAARRDATRPTAAPGRAPCPNPTIIT